MTKQQYLSPKEFSEATGIPLVTVRRWLRSGKLAHLPRPRGVRQYRIPRTAIVAVTSSKQKDSANVLPFKAREAECQSN